MEISELVPVATKENQTSEVAAAVQQVATANPLAVDPALLYCVAEEQKLVTLLNGNAAAQSSPWAFAPLEMNSSEMNKKHWESNNKTVPFPAVSFDKNGAVFFIDSSNNPED